MLEPLTHSQLMFRHRSLGRLRDRLFVQTRTLARRLNKLRPDQRVEATAINIEIRQVLLDVEKVEADIVQIQFRLENRVFARDSGNWATESPASKRHKDKIEWLSKAIVLVNEHPEWTDAKIAETVKRHPAQLTRSKMFQRAALLARGDKGSLPGGHISKGAKNLPSDVEAYAKPPSDADVRE